MAGPFGVETILIGAGWGIPVTDLTIPVANPKHEYLAVGPGRLNPKIPQSLTHAFDDLSRQLGYKAYEAMLTDPTVQSSYLGLKLAILDGGCNLAPTVAPDPAKRAALKAKSRSSLSPPAGDEADGSADTPAAASLSPDEALSQEVCDFCTYCIRRLEEFPAVLLGLLDSAAFGVKLAEPTMEVLEYGDYSGKLGWKSIKVKPNFAWQFIVDAWLNVRGILSFIPADGQFLIVGHDKFAYMTWMPHNADPRGSSHLRAAYAAWNLKIQTTPQCYRHLVRWGSPGIDFEMAEGDETPRMPTDARGVPLPGATLLDPVSYHTQNLVAYESGSVFVHPAGSKVTVIQPEGKGEAFWTGFDYFDRQICLAIELSARGTLEAKNGSKADSETGQDKRGPVITYGQETLANVIRFQLLKRLVALNYGDEVADKHTPLVTFGKAEHQDRPTLWTAVAALKRSGYLGDSQLAELDDEIGLPVRDGEADAKAAAIKAAAMPAPVAKPGQPAVPAKDSDGGK